MARNNQRGSKNNNPEGRNQYNNGWMDTAKDRPVAAAAAAAAAVGAGVFLWSRRNQISDQISNLSDQFSEWTGSQQFGSTQSGSSSGDFEFADTGTTSGSTGSTRSTGSTSRSGGGARSSRGKSGQSGNFGGTTGGGATGGGGTTGGAGGTAF